MLKRFLAKEITLGGIADLKRNIGNISKETRVSQDELLEYIEVIVREIVEEQMVKLKKSGAK